MPHYIIASCLAQHIHVYQNDRMQGNRESGERKPGKTVGIPDSASCSWGPLWPWQWRRSCVFEAWQLLHIALYMQQLCIHGSVDQPCRIEEACDLAEPWRGVVHTDHNWQIVQVRSWQNNCLQTILHCHSWLTSNCLQMILPTYHKTF
jgi:hypothetical protein